MAGRSVQSDIHGEGDRQRCTMRNFWRRTLFRHRRTIGISDGLAVQRPNSHGHRVGSAVIKNTVENIGGTHNYLGRVVESVSAILITVRTCQ